MEIAAVGQWLAGAGGPSSSHLPLSSVFGRYKPDRLSSIASGTIPGWSGTQSGAVVLVGWLPWLLVVPSTDWRDQDRLGLGMPKLKARGRER